MISDAGAVELRTAWAPDGPEARSGALARRPPIFRHDPTISSVGGIWTPDKQRSTGVLTTARRYGR